MWFAVESESPYIQVNMVYNRQQNRGTINDEYKLETMNGRKLIKETQYG